MSAQSTRKTGLPIASRPSQLDRASHLRTDKQALDSLFAQSLTFEVSGGKVAVTPTGLELLPSKDIDLGSSEKFFLGISNEDERPPLRKRHLKSILVKANTKLVQLGDIERTKG